MMAKLDLESALKAAVAPTRAELVDAPAPAPAYEEIPIPEGTPDGERDRADVAPAAPADPQRTGAPARKRKRPAPAEHTAETVPTSTVGLAIELPVALNARLDAYRRSSRKSHPTVLLDAIESTYDQLPALIRAALGVGEEPTRPSLFGRSPRQATPIVLGEPGEKVRHSLRVTSSTRQLLDEMAGQFQAPSRNFLIVTAYEQHLPPLQP